MSLVLAKPSLEELRQLIGSAQHLERERSDFTLFREGFPKGSIIEISGHGKTELVSLFLKEHPDMKVAWIEKELTINPYGLFQKGVKTENVLFIEAGKQLAWCINQALQSGCFQALVTNLDVDRSTDEKDLRRYQLLSERCGAHFFLLSEDLHQSWVPNLQLKVSKKKIGFNIETAKRRMG